MNPLNNLADYLSRLYASTLPGEEFAKNYAKQPKAFRKLIRSDYLTEKALKAFFKEQSQRIQDSIDTFAYEKEIRKASIADFITAKWTDEGLLLKVLLSETLIHALSGGGESIEEEFNVDTDWSDTDSTALKYLDKYTLKLAKDITGTTADRVKNGLRLSVSNNETIEQMRARVNSVVDNPRRAAMIAHTESVRVYSQGRLAVAKEVGIGRKKWDASPRACPICAPIDGVEVALDKNFPGGFDTPPAHPNCRCLLQMVWENK